MCIRVEGHIKVSETSHLKYLVWLPLCKWPIPDSFGKVLYKFKFSTFPDTWIGAKTLRLDSGPFVRHCNNGFSTKWKEQDWAGVAWDPAFTFSEDWTCHLMEIIMKQVLECAEHLFFCLWTSSGKCSQAAVQWTLNFWAYLSSWNKKASCLEPDQSRDKEGLPRPEYLQTGSALRCPLALWHSQAGWGQVT